MGDIGSAFSGAMGNIGGAMSAATSGLGGFGNALSGFGSAMNALGGGGQSAGQAYGAGGVDPNTGQPIAQETPQQSQAQSQGPPTGTTPPGVDPATQIGGTQSRPSQGYASVLAQLAKNVQTQRQPTQLSGAQPPDAPGTVVPDNQGGGAYTPTQAGMPAPQNEPGVTTLPSNVVQNPPLPPPRPKDTANIPIGGGAGNVQEAPRGTPAADAPAPAATPVAATDGPSAAPQAQPQGQGGGMEPLIGELMQMFLPLLFQGLLGGSMGGGLGAAMLPMLMGGMMGGRGGFGRSPFGMMMGGRRMIPGFGGGFLRAGYYPDGRGGFGFHPGGFHGGWRPHYINAYNNFPGGGGAFGRPGQGGWNAPTTDGSPQNGAQAGAAAASGANTSVDGVPANVLNEARNVAMRTGGDPQAVADFMRQQGYPQHAGEWCGDFCAAVTHAAGMIPPPGSAVAGNWARFGTPRQGAPRPGDIAVIGGWDARTGMMGKHVTIVERVNPDGTFIGLGGNQAGGQLTRSRFPINNARFRVPPTAGGGTTTARGATAPPPSNQTDFTPGELAVG